MNKNVAAVGTLFLSALSFFSLSCNHSRGEAAKDDKQKGATEVSDPANTKLATFGGGCFWCVEAVFERIDGVISAESGYSGGSIKNPTYEQVCSGTTGHAEVCQVRFDPAKVSFEELLDVFFHTHDPTTRNRQGNDIGTQYRSVVFYHDDAQKAATHKFVEKLDKSGKFRNSIVTEISPLGTFYAAEKYHQDYFRQNPNQGYCRAIIRPKVNKLEKEFKDKLKD